MKFLRPVKHLLVDLDGTLLGNRPLPMTLEFMGRALNILRKYGGWRKAVSTLIEINKEFYHPTSKARNDMRVVELVSKRLKLAEEEGRRVLKDGVLVIFPELKRHFYPLPGAKEFLEWAKDRFDLTLATNPVWPIEVIEMRVRWAGIDPTIFRGITHIRQMHSCKPAPDYYTEILELQKIRAEESLLIGNDVKMDLPATNVGIPVFIVDAKKPPNAATALKPKGAKAPSWKGSFAQLKRALEHQEPHND